MKKRILIIILSLSLIMGFSLVALTAPVTLQWNLGTEPPTLDPALATDTTSVDVIEQLFLGLTDFDDETMEVVPELATSWEVSEDGLVWAFHMRKDVKWTDGKPVTAHDIEYAVKRTCDPATASNYAYVLYIIKGAKEVNTGEISDLNHIGVKAIDDYTIQFALNHPAGYFPSIAGMWVTRPVPKWTIEKYGEKWTEPENIVTNGPYLLTKWVHEDELILEKNPDYFDADNVQIERVN
ncbi:MAG: peptide ABC transporter substrate-binding protein, partial [Atribacteria sp.]|nr:peptide ABC transporter substrate-binding protein [Candidatus Atribacteria bacterium]